MNKNVKKIVDIMKYEEYNFLFNIYIFIERYYLFKERSIKYALTFICESAFGNAVYTQISSIKNIKISNSNNFESYTFCILTSIQINCK